MTDFKELYGPNIAIIGSVLKRNKFANKCVRAYKEANYNVFPIYPNPAFNNETDIVEGLFKKE